MKIQELSGMAVTDPEQCIEAVSALVYMREHSSTEGSPTLSVQELDSLAELSLGLLFKKFDDAFAAGKWLDAKRCYESLAALGKPGGLGFLPESGRQEAETKILARTSGDERFSIFFGLAKEFKDKGLYAPAVHYYRAARNAVGSEKSKADLEKISEWSLWAKSTGEDSKPSIATMVSGVVTVYVDKGLRIENGYGIPDRVLGTAFQIDGSGYYLTNYHVVQSEVDPTYKGYSRLSIRPSANPESRIPAKVIGWDKDLDLALIQSSEKAGYTYKIPENDNISNGQGVFAIGSPVGLENSVSSGIISATGRHFLALGDAIQIDVPVNPGNSGSPLVDKDGVLEGIIFAGLPNFQGINFALPVSWIRDDLPLLFQGGEVRHSWLGLLLTKTIDGELRVVYCYPGTGDTFKPGDTLLAIDSIKATDIQAIQAYLAFKPPKSLCMVEIRRDGVVRHVLRRVLPEFQSSFEKALTLDDAENLMEGAGGMLVENISLPRGPGGIYKVLEAWPGMAADESGILSGDTFKFMRLSMDKASQAIFLDVAVKSRMSGYLERILRIAAPIEATNFI
jgi:S1-C subfamily serine protease